MQAPQAFGIIAGILSVISFLPYIKSIFTGDTKPQRAAYGIWTLVAILTFSSYISLGATFTVWVVLAGIIMQMLVFVLSFKYGMGGLKKLDIACLSLAVIGAVVWIMTKRPEVALYVGIFLEFLGFVPIFKKSYLYPKTENLLSWFIATFAAFINILAITRFSFNIAFYPLLILLSDAVVTSLLIIGLKFKSNLTN